ncbi:MOSC domain-containing protein [Iodobacter ciconiae]|uniref:MOSC domain-containing protein n=1 Tax=Iodobacter ciconiae TaxID=2496266 RepID=A0A3S8ZT07_9NEIS|nr:MOSC domain-containing protein [Iodobacter ciconiae]AZN36643.1 MOSC domain-containing protein [Iodobacter ciconiae]
MPTQLTGLYRYPIKSGQGQRLQQTELLSSGMPFDRTWMIARPNGRLVTGREFPKLVLLSATPDHDGLTLNAPGMPALFIATSLFSQPHPASVWKNDFTAHHGASDADAWLSAYLEEQVILLWSGFELNRRSTTNVPIAFVDGHPLLLISEASLGDISERVGRSLSMQRFRPNLIVDGGSAFVEDSWKKIRIGEAIFNFVKPCERCAFTTVNPKTGEKSHDQEPLRTLAQYRKTAAGVLFGQNINVEKSGIISEGMTVEVLE